MLNESLRRTVSEVSAERPPLHFVQSSSSLPTGAIILHGFRAGEKSARVIVKTARNPGMPNSLQREWSSLAAVRRDAGLARLTSRGIAAFDLDGAQFFAYTGLPGRTMSAAYRSRLWPARASQLQRFAVRALRVALLVHRSASRPAPSTLVAEDLLDELDALRDAVPLSPALCRRATEAAATIAATPGTLPHGRVHGDFSPHNLMIPPGRDVDATCIIDWEHMEDARPQHLDIFRFIGSSLLMGMRGERRLRGLRSMRNDAQALVVTLLQPWLVAMDAEASTWTAPERLEALWWHYWIHATRRELERHATTDPTGSALLRIVTELAQ